MFGMVPKVQQYVSLTNQGLTHTHFGSKVVAPHVLVDVLSM